MRVVFRYVVAFARGSVRGASWQAVGRPAMLPGGILAAGTGADCCGIATPAPGT